MPKKKPKQPAVKEPTDYSYTISHCCDAPIKEGKTAVYCTSCKRSCDTTTFGTISSTWTPDPHIVCQTHEKDVQSLAEKMGGRVATPEEEIASLREEILQLRGFCEQNSNDIHNELEKNDSLFQEIIKQDAELSNLRAFVEDVRYLKQNNEILDSTGRVTGFRTMVQHRNLLLRKYGLDKKD
jgi:hypothetical protein